MLSPSPNPPKHGHRLHHLIVDLQAMELPGGLQQMGRQPSDAYLEVCKRSHAKVFEKYACMYSRCGAYTDRLTGVGLVLLLAVVDSILMTCVVAGDSSLSRPTLSSRKSLRIPIGGTRMERIDGCTDFFWHGCCTAKSRQKSAQTCHGPTKKNDFVPVFCVHDAQVHNRPRGSSGPSS